MLESRVVACIRNEAELLSHGHVTLRRAAIEIASAAIAAVDPASAVHKVVAVDQERLIVGDRVFEVPAGRHIFVIGAGKATFPIAAALDEILDFRIHRGLITCKTGQEGSLRNIDIQWAGHPLPDHASHQAAQRTKALLCEVRPGDIVLSCFTGGSSALFVEPVDDISLSEKIQVNRVLLGSGANVVEINAVRKHLSQVKGGKLIRALPAGVHLINLTVSDVIGDPLDCITDPTVPDSSTLANARATLDKYRLWSRIPRSVAEYLRQATAANETCREADLLHLDRLDVLLINNDAACIAAASAARQKGFAPLILSTAFEGESRELGRFMAAIAKQAFRGECSIDLPCALIGGGESTVLLGDEVGAGGPNQEFAVSFADEISDYPSIVALGMDTDGTDGPTDIAGGLVDATTSCRARDLSLDLHDALVRHDASPLLCSLGDAVMTGATGTNVNDLKLVLVGRR